MTRRQARSAATMIFTAALLFAQGAEAVPNPASVYCAGLGYRSRVESTDAGQLSICIFPDDSECEEWTFYRGECGKEHSYCETHGGVLSVETGDICHGSQTAKCAVCTLPDGTRCLEMAYFEGRCGATDGGPRDGAQGDGRAADQGAPADSAAIRDASIADSTAHTDGGIPADDDGCSCAASARLHPGSWLLFVGLALLVLVRRG